MEVHGHNKILRRTFVYKKHEQMLIWLTLIVAITMGLSLIRYMISG